MSNIKTSKYDIRVNGDFGPFCVSLSLSKPENELELVTIKFSSDIPAVPKPAVIEWYLPTAEIFAQWNPHLGNNRYVPPLWGQKWTSKATSNAPIHCLYNLNGVNQLTYALSDALNPVDIACGIEAADATIKCSATLFTQYFSPIKDYTVVLRLDSRNIPYYDSIGDVSVWWESFENYQSAKVPEAARLPMYSTWYTFLQNISTDKIIKQCELAKPLGCETVIVDDGWQTVDSGGDYTFCGDWEVTPVKIPDMKALVDGVHKIGMKFMLWYSVPFIGRSAKIFSRFEGKYLDNGTNRCSLDPRFPDVREYLIDTYENAVRKFGYDGLKLDFVDSFNLTQHSCKNPLEFGGDYNNIDDAVDRLLKDTLTRLNAINPDFLIEFRQSYIGPLMRTYGNMFRAMDCPNDALSNRVRTIDIRLLCGNTAAHSDMLMWNNDDTPETAALQILNILFSVPQISVKLEQVNPTHIIMLKFWLNFWLNNRDVLLDGKLQPTSPELLYPSVSAYSANKFLSVIYSDYIIHLSEKQYAQYMLINASAHSEVVLNSSAELKNIKLKICNCCGEVVCDKFFTIPQGVSSLPIPRSGIAFIEK